MFITIGWLHKALEEAYLEGETTTQVQKQLAMGCSEKLMGCCGHMESSFKYIVVIEKRQTFDLWVMLLFEKKIQSGHNGEVKFSNNDFCGRLQRIF